MISSRQHRIVREFRAVRDAADGLLLDGWHLLEEALAAGLAVTRVAVTPAARQRHDAALASSLPSTCELVTVSPSVMDALAPTKTPTGIVAIARPRVYALADLCQPVPALVMVAVDVQEPGNAGAIVRAAEAGGATGVVLAGQSARPWGWKVLRAAMGSMFRLPVRHDADAQDALARLRASGLQVLAAVPRAVDRIEDVDLRVPSAIVLGGEGGGLAQALLSTADAQVRIDMSGRVESLNVAVAAALLVFEARRQRHPHGAPPLHATRKRR